MSRTHSFYSQKYAGSKLDNDSNSKKNNRTASLVMPDVNNSSNSNVPVVPKRRAKSQKTKFLAKYGYFDLSLKLVNQNNVDPNKLATLYVPLNDKKASLVEFPDIENKNTSPSNMRARNLTSHLRSDKKGRPQSLSEKMKILCETKNSKSNIQNPVEFDFSSLSYGKKRSSSKREEISSTDFTRGFYANKCRHLIKLGNSKMSNDSPFDTSELQHNVKSVDRKSFFDLSRNPSIDSIPHMNGSDILTIDQYFTDVRHKMKDDTKVKLKKLSSMFNSPNLRQNMNHLNRANQGFEVNKDPQRAVDVRTNNFLDASHRGNRNQIRHEDALLRKNIRVSKEYTTTKYIYTCIQQYKHRCYHFQVLCGRSESQNLKH